MTHTKGGWNRNIKPASKYPTIFAGRNTHVAAVKTVGLSDDVQIEANINLIVVSAPDMLEALETLYKEYDKLLLCGDCCSPISASEFPEGQAALAAIRKAKGE